MKTDKLIETRPTLICTTDTKQNVTQELKHTGE